MYNLKTIIQKLRNHIIASFLVNIKTHKNKLTFNGYLLKLPFQKLDICHLHIIKFREEENHYLFPVHTPNSFLSYFSFLIFFRAEVDLKSLDNQDGFFHLYVGDRQLKHLSALKNISTSLLKKDQLVYYENIQEKQYKLFVPYYDDIVHLWRLDIYTLSHQDKNDLSILLETKTPPNRDKNIWFIGEYNNSARDNGMHFYNYLRQNRPDIEVYYIIEKNCPEIKNLIDIKNIIYYGSYKHLLLSQRVSTLIFSHMPNYLLPKINQLSTYKNAYQAFKTIFLQHGVIATTSSVKPFRKALRHYSRFIVSSAQEKDIVTQYLGYETSEIAITGLARWDTLFKPQHIEKDILIIPTWRDGLEKVTEKEFMQSNYYRIWNQLLSDKKLHQYLKQYNVQINFYLHNILARFSHLFFQNNLVHSVNGENIQQLLANNALMITDYSSIAFDFAYLQKPIIYYTFDLKEMQKLRPGKQYIDYKKDLPGAVCISQQEVLQEIKESIKDHFLMKEQYIPRLKKFFSYSDTKNCERIYKTIMEIV